MGDIIRAMLGNPLDAMAKADIVADEPAIAEQVKTLDDEGLKALVELAEKAAQKQDELKAAIGDKQGELKKLKGELKESMLKYGLKELRIAGRPPIELTEKSSRKANRKNIISTMQEAFVKKLTDEERRDSKKVKEAEAEGKMKALNLWNAIPQTPSQSLSIPDPTPVEPDSPY